MPVCLEVTGQGPRSPPFEGLAHRRAGKPHPPRDLVLRQAGRLQPNSLARTAHINPLRWLRLLFWALPKGRPDQANGGAPGRIIELWGGGGIIPLQRGGIIPELEGASSEISTYIQPGVPRGARRRGRATAPPPLAGGHKALSLSLPSGPTSFALPVHLTMEQLPPPLFTREQSAAASSLDKPATSSR